VKKSVRAADELAEICTFFLYSSCTAQNCYIIYNHNNQIQKFYHPLRMTGVSRKFLAV
jgi:hypothetical protein